MQKWSIRAGIIILSIFFILFSLQLAKGNERQTELFVLAAASLTDAMKKIETVYETRHSDVDLVITFASSGKLQKQIEQGAPAHLFLSAGQEKMNALIRQNLVVSSKPLIKNRLVLITPLSSKIDAVTDLTKQNVERIAIGHPQTVPAGRYALETLRSFGLWQTLAEKYVFTADVRQVLAYVETKNVAAGFVYQTDARIAENIRVACVIDEKRHDAIVYPVGLIQNPTNQSQSRAFYNWLDTEKARKIFKRYGFTPAGGDMR